MSEVQDSQRQKSWSGWWLAGVAGVVVVLLGLAVYFFGRQYNPYFIYHPDVKSAQSLIQSARNRPLNPEEFREALRLLSSREATAQLSVIAIIELEAGRDEARKAEGLKALQERVNEASPNVARAMRIAIERLNSPRKP
jgi:hypothetical protein